MKKIIINPTMARTFYPSTCPVVRRFPSLSAKLRPFPFLRFN